MPSDYFSAAVPEPYRILGLRLLPLSLGRYRLMRRFGVAFVLDGEEKAGIQDLLLGVLICSMRCDEFLPFLKTKDFTRKLRRWGRRFKHGFNYVEKILLFKRYVEVHSEVPRFWEAEDGCGESGAHWSQGIEVILRGELGWTREEINEEPLSKAIADYFKWCENKGIVELMDADQLAQVEAIEKAEVANGA